MLATINPKAPPVISPMNSDGLKTPPTNPEPKEREVATIFAAIKAMRSQSGTASLRARSVAS